MDEYDSMLCSMLGISFAKSFYGDQNNEIPLPEIETRIDTTVCCRCCSGGLDILS
jgi:hypothetical protein